MPLTPDLYGPLMYPPLAGDLHVDSTWGWVLAVTVSTTPPTNPHVPTAQNHPLTPKGGFSHTSTTSTAEIIADTPLAPPLATENIAPLAQITPDFGESIHTPLIPPSTTKTITTATRMRPIPSPLLFVPRHWIWIWI